MTVMTATEYRGCGTYSSALFFRILVYCFIAVAFAGKGASADTAEMRALWVVRNSVTSEEKAHALVDYADSLGINTLFLQVRGRGDAYYRSYFVPGPQEFPQIPYEFDPLEAVIRLAHERGIEVHAWFNMYLTWSADGPPSNPAHLLHEHPEWFMVSSNGVSMADCPIDSVRNGYCEGRFISPALEEVRNYLSRVVTEVLVNYDVDGIHLDYVRYPGRNHDFSNSVRNSFMSDYSVDPVEVVNNGDVVDPSVIYLQKWIEFKAQHVDDQVRSIARRISMVKRDVKLSAAVKPSGIAAYYEFGQNWMAWLNEDIMDFVVTMSYFPDDEFVRHMLMESLQQVDPKKVVGGIGLYKLDPDSASRQITLMRTLGLSGFSLFSYTSLQEDPRYETILKTAINSVPEYSTQTSSPEKE